jgi:membrane protein implicated in regulation of membrane protease activity
MLVMVGLYTLTARAGVSVSATAVTFGLSLAASIAALWLYYRRVRAVGGSGTAGGLGTADGASTANGSGAVGGPSGGGQ